MRPLASVRRKGKGLVKTAEIWGTVISVDVRDAIDESVVDIVFDWCRHVDDLFSTWRTDTEISRIARRELAEEDASPEVREVFALCDRVSIESGGAFDITFGADPRVAPRPGFAAIDPSGIVKGWAIERAAHMMLSRGATNFMINAGGDVVVRGTPAPAHEWRIGIQHPWIRDKVAAVVGGTDIAVATSGSYERGEHIIDPKTGQPPTGLAAVTVIGPDLGLADGYATAAVVMGDAGMQWLATLPGIEGMGITEQRDVVSTDGFDRYRRG